MKINQFIVFGAILAVAVGVGCSALSLTNEQSAKIAEQLKLLQVLGSDPKVVEAVKEANTNPPAQYKSMTQETWKGLSILSPEIKFFTANDLAVYLKTKRTLYISEMFISAANGNKVAFFAKTTGWNHSGKPKHDIPMKGKTWIGDPEQDESTGKIQVQISFPILDGKKPIGSMVIGLDLSKL